MATKEELLAKIDTLKNDITIKDKELQELVEEVAKLERTEKRNKRRPDFLDECAG